MKRYGQLFDTFTSFANLLSAYQKARRGAVGKPEAQQFTFFLEQELFQLQEELQHGTYQPQPYRYFQIFDPKERTISVAAFRDRVVHHALINILEPIYERCFIHDSYATRKGKGTHKAIARAQSMLRKTGWFWKSDIDKYFDSYCGAARGTTNRPMCVAPIATTTRLRIATTISVFVFPIQASSRLPVATAAGAVSALSR